MSIFLGSTKGGKLSKSQKEEMLFEIAYLEWSIYGYPQSRFIVGNPLSKFDWEKTPMYLEELRKTKESLRGENYNN